jgi:hypothetical protein
MRAVVLAALLLVGLTGCEGTAGPPGGGPSGSGGTAPPHACLTVEPRHLEVCTAYVANATVAGRYPYYQLGHSSNRTLADAATSRLRSRYTDQAYQYLVRQTAGWPSSVKVDLPNIRIDSVTVPADARSAVLRTHESWRVEDDAGRVLFVETNRAHVITLRRVPGVLVDKWVVAAIQ